MRASSGTEGWRSDALLSLEAIEATMREAVEAYRRVNRLAPDAPVNVLTPSASTGAWRARGATVLPSSTRSLLYQPVGTAASPLDVNPGSGYSEDMPANPTDYTCRFCGEEFSTPTEALDHGCPTPSVTDWRYSDVAGSVHLFDGHRTYGANASAPPSQVQIAQVAALLSVMPVQDDERQRIIAGRIDQAMDSRSGTSDWLRALERSGPVRTAGGDAPRVNLYAGACRYCGQRIEAGAGELVREGSRWFVQHSPPCPVTPVVACGTYHLASGTYRVLFTNADGSGSRTVRRLLNATEVRLTAENRRATLNAIARQFPQAVLSVGEAHASEGEEAPVPQAPAEEVPDGYYALRDGRRMRFSRSRPRYTGQATIRRAFVSINGRSWARINLESAERAVLAEGVRTTTVRYGEVTGSCGVCGRTLTDPVSIARHIGPTCARNRGWV